MKVYQGYYVGCNEVGFAENGEVKLIQILKVGEFEHETYGKIIIKPEDLRQFKENFDAGVRQIQPAINYNHNRTIAAGWIRSLQLKDNDSQLWAEPDWTESGMKSVKSKEYRYFSAELAWKYKDAETGKVYKNVLLGGALTNYPFIKGMQVIDASEKAFNSKGNKPMKLEEIKIALSEHGFDFNEMKKQSDAHEGLKTQVADLTEQVKAKDTELTELKTKNTELSEKVEKIQKERVESKFAEIVETGMKDGKFGKDFAEKTLRPMCEKMGVDFVEATVKDMPKAISTDPKGHGKDGNIDSGKDANTMLSEVAQKIADKDNISFSEAYDRACAANPELVKKLK